MNDNIARPKQYYLKKMIRLFVSDTIKLLDLALTDDEIDPQISACIVWDRFEAFLYLYCIGKWMLTHLRAGIFGSEWIF